MVAKQHSTNSHTSYNTANTHTHTHTHTGDTESPFPADSTWPNLKSPHRKKDKDVFRFLSKQSDTNYTVRRHQLQMSRILEKNQHVKKVKRGGKEGEEEGEEEEEEEKEEGRERERREKRIGEGSEVDDINRM